MVNAQRIPIPFEVDGKVFHTFVKIFGNLDAARQPSHRCGPLVVLHGGPGMSHDSMLSLADLASTTAVVMYDQLGSGESSTLAGHPNGFITIDLFIRELENVLDNFGISKRFNLLGQSWGGSLAAEFVVRRKPEGLRSLVLANASASAELRNTAVADLQALLPEHVRNKMMKVMKKKGVDSRAFKAAMLPYHKLHTCRLEEWPEEVSYSISLLDEECGKVVLNAILDGEKLSAEWDIRDRIHLMRHVPTLLINGAYDFITDEVCAPYFWGIDRVKWMRFAKSSHMPHYEERELFMELVGRWLCEVEVVTHNGADGKAPSRALNS